MTKKVATTDPAIAQTYATCVLSRTSAPHIVKETFFVATFVQFREERGCLVILTESIGNCASTSNTQPDFFVENSVRADACCVGEGAGRLRDVLHHTLQLIFFSKETSGCCGHILTAQVGIASLRAAIAVFESAALVTADTMTSGAMMVLRSPMIKNRVLLLSVLGE